MLLVAFTCQELLQNKVTPMNADKKGLNIVYSSLLWMEPTYELGRVGGWNHCKLGLVDARKDKLGGPHPVIVTCSG